MGRVATRTSTATPNNARWPAGSCLRHQTLQTETAQIKTGSSAHAGTPCLQQHNCLSSTSNSPTTGITSMYTTQQLCVPQPTAALTPTSTSNLQAGILVVLLLRLLVTSCTCSCTFAPLLVLDVALGGRPVGARV